MLIVDLIKHLALDVKTLEHYEQTGEGTLCVLLEDLENVSFLSLISSYYGDHSDEYEQFAELFIKLNNNGQENSTK